MLESGHWLGKKPSKEEIRYSATIIAHSTSYVDATRQLECRCCGPRAGTDRPLPPPLTIASLWHLGVCDKAASGDQMTFQNEFKRTTVARVIQSSARLTSQGATTAGWMEKVALAVELQWQEAGEFSAHQVPPSKSWEGLAIGLTALTLSLSLTYTYTLPQTESRR